MNGRTAKRLRRGLFDEMVASGTVVSSGYRIAGVRRRNGERAQMLVCTGFRQIYREMKRDLKAMRSRPPSPATPDLQAIDGARVRRRAARARDRVKWKRRAAEILAAREEAA